MKHVEKFRKDCPKTEDSFRKPASSERKLYEKKTARKPQAEIVVDRMEKPEKTKKPRPKHIWDSSLQTPSQINGSTKS